MSNKPQLLESIQEVVLTTLYTAAVRDAVPVSIIIVADSGTAKSKLVKMYLGPNLHHTDSFTSNGLFDLMSGDREGRIRWLMIPDMNPTLSRPPRTVGATVANLLTLTMDGTCRCDDGRDEKRMEHKPIGLISAATPDIYRKQERKWFSLGLRRRIIPIFFEYTTETTRKLVAMVGDDKITGKDFQPLMVELPDHNPAISEIIKAKIESMGTIFSVNLGMARLKDSAGGGIKWWVRKIVPISPVITLRTLAKANAIRHSRGSVTDEDIDFVTRFLDFTNPSAPKQI